MALTACCGRAAAAAVSSAAVVGGDDCSQTFSAVVLTKWSVKTTKAANAVKANIFKRRTHYDGHFLQEATELGLSTR